MNVLIYEKLFRFFKEVNYYFCCFVVVGGVLYFAFALLCFCFALLLLCFKSEFKFKFRNCYVFVMVKNDSLEIYSF